MADKFSAAKMVFAQMLALVGFGRSRKDKLRVRDTKRGKRLHAKAKATHRIRIKKRAKADMRRKMARASKQVNWRRAA